MTTAEKVILGIIILIIVLIALAIAVWIDSKDKRKQRRKDEDFLIIMADKLELNVDYFMIPGGSGKSKAFLSIKGMRKMLEIPEFISELNLLDKKFGLPDGHSIHLYKQRIVDMERRVKERRENGSI